MEKDQLNEQDTKLQENQEPETDCKTDYKLKKELWACRTELKQFKEKLQTAPDVEVKLRASERERLKLQQLLKELREKLSRAPESQKFEKLQAENNDLRLQMEQLKEKLESNKELSFKFEAENKNLRRELKILKETNCMTVYQLDCELKTQELERRALSLKVEELNTIIHKEKPLRLKAYGEEDTYQLQNEVAALHQAGIKAEDCNKEKEAEAGSGEAEAGEKEETGKAKKSKKLSLMRRFIKLKKKDK